MSDTMMSDPATNDDTYLGHTRERAIELLEVPGIARDDGRVECPICFKVFDTNNSVGPHKRTHAKVLGIERRFGPTSKLPRPSRAKRSVRTPKADKWDHRVSCPRCDRTLKRKSIGVHLERQHDVARSMSLELAISLPPVDEPSTAVEPVEPASNGTAPEIDFNDMTVAILLKMTNADTIKIVDLPNVFEWVQHTRALSDHLNR